MRTILLIMVLMVGASPLTAQKSETVKLPKVLDLLSQSSGKIQVLNFWATWCAPCVKELPLFEKLNAENSSVDVTLISMDLDLDSDPEKVHKFVARKKLGSRIWLLNEQNPNDWIDKVDKNWSGALPATIIYNPATGKRKFIGQELHEGDLEKYIAEVQ